MLFEVKEIDRELYNEHLAGFLPPRMVDIHAHVWLKSFFRETSERVHGAKWSRLVAEDNSIEDLCQTYRLMFPRQEVTPLIFGLPGRDVILKRTNDYVSCVAQANNLPSLIVSMPAWPRRELGRLVDEDGFLGLKPYLSFASAHIALDDITIFDFLFTFFEFI